MLSFENFEELLSKKFSKLFSLYKNEKYIGINTNKENVFLKGLGSFPPFVAIIYIVSINFCEVGAIIEAVPKIIKIIQDRQNKINTCL